MQVAQDSATALSSLSVGLKSAAPGARRVPTTSDPAQRRGGRVRAGQDLGRDDQGVPRRERLAGRRRASASSGAALTDNVVAALLRRQPQGGTFHIEDIQDQVELALMRSGRARRGPRLRAVPRGAGQGARRKRRRQGRFGDPRGRGGERKPLDRVRLQRLVESACEGLADASAPAILEATLRDLYDGVPMQEVRKSCSRRAR